MKVRLTRKHAESIDGIDLTGYNVGDVIDLTFDEARLIVAEDWAHSDRRVLASPSEHRRRAEDRTETKRSRFPEQDRVGLAADQPPRTRTSK